jgi:hypothetical protein
MTEPAQISLLSYGTHGSKALNRGATYKFCATSQLIQVGLDEIKDALPAMPLGFSPIRGAMTLVGITSFAPSMNLFVEKNGRWTGSYVPAAIRSYPFRLVMDQSNDRAALGVVEDAEILVDAARGEPLFNPDGSASKLVSETLTLLKKCESVRSQTQQAVTMLNSAGLLVPWPATLKHDSSMTVIESLFRVDEAALNKVDAQSLIKLRDSGALIVAYGQLFSMSRLEMLAKLAAKQMAQNADLKLLDREGTISFDNLG